MSTLKLIDLKSTQTIVSNFLTTPWFMEIAKSKQWSIERQRAILLEWTKGDTKMTIGNWVRTKAKLPTHNKKVWWTNEVVS